MPKKKTASEVLAALPTGGTLEVAGELNALSSKAARRLASEIAVLTGSGKNGRPKAVESATESAICKLLEEELTLFAIKAGRVLAKSEVMRSRVLAASGKVSAAKRSKSSNKAMFHAWVAEDAKSHPASTASSIVERFIKANPGLRFSVESGLRYLRPSSRTK